MTYFYSHIVEIDEIVSSLDEMGLSGDQKKHLASLIDATIHQTVLDLILSKLSESDKRVFVAKMRDGKNDKELMNFLNDKVDNIEGEIKGVVKELKEELHEDIKESKKR